MKIRLLMEPYADKPGAALSLLKMFRVMVRFAMSLDADNPLRLHQDPSTGIERPKTNEIRSGSDDELAAFEQPWPIGSKQRTAYALMLYAGSARVDTHQMTWRQVASTLAYTRNKTGVAVTVDVHSELQAALAATSRNHVTILNTEFGKPFTVAGFSLFMRDAIKKAGLPLDCKPHGLRKTLGRRLADAGCSAHEIMAVLGHKTLEEAERYTRDADRRRGGRSAIAKLEGLKAAPEHQENVNSQPTPSGLGKQPKS
jgi:enterobacteria phage integrase